MKPVYYSEYLQLDKILNAQELESDKHQKHAHDEMLFVVIHQAYELWFKQLLFEADSVIGIFSQESINDNSPDLQIAVHRLKRMGTILKVLVQQFLTNVTDDSCESFLFSAMPRLKEQHDPSNYYRIVKEELLGQFDQDNMPTTSEIQPFCERLLQLNRESERDALSEKWN
jgi:tryptophan 2,3-dioxygenase